MSYFGNILGAITGKAARVVSPVNQLPFVMEGVRADFADWNARYIIETGSKKAASFLQCLFKLAVSYPEAPLCMYEGRGKDAEKIDDHPLLTLMDYPNEDMDWLQLQIITAFYHGIGGDVYYHIERNGAGEPIGIQPKHAAEMWPVPSKARRIKHYLYDVGDGRPIEVPKEDVIQLIWPLIDPARPWRSMAPLEHAGSAIDVVAECRRFAYALLKNDAVVRTAIIDTEGKIQNDTQKEALEQKFQRERSGDNVGKVAVFRGGLKPIRLGLDMNELAFDALERVPEVTIAGSLGMDVIFAGLTAGLEHTTFDNFEGSRRKFYEGTLVPLWRIQAGALTRKLLPRDSGLSFWHDTTEVKALRADQNALSNRVVVQFEKNVITRNEARAALDYEPVEDEQDGFFNEVSGGSAAGDGQGTDGNSDSQRAGAAATDGSGERSDSGTEEEGTVAKARAILNGNGHVKSAGGHSDPFSRRIT